MVKREKPPRANGSGRHYVLTPNQELHKLDYTPIEKRRFEHVQASAGLTRIILTQNTLRGGESPLKQSFTLCMAL